MQIDKKKENIDIHSNNINKTQIKSNKNESIISSSKIKLPNNGGCNDDMILNNFMENLQETNIS